MEKLAQSTVATENNLVNEISQIVAKIIPDQRTEQKQARSALVSDVKEISFTGPANKKLGAIIIYLPYVLAQKNLKELPKIVNEVQNKKGKHTFVVHNRTMINKNADYKQMTPRNRTLTSVYDALLEDLIAPGFIVGRRTCIRLNGSSYTKVFINEESKKFLEERSSVIEKIYFSLTNRNIKIEFRAESSFAVLPKRRVKKETTSKKNVRKTQAKAN